MNEKQAEMMRGLVAAQAALWEVIDNEHNAKQVLRMVMQRVCDLEREIQDG